ncbi:hypothetical protein F4810DRAFT_102806 [Camillea tinctor]|nr:hypothetical protein F4810DRAFT_102806 [Camillea tinctor]
MWTDALCIDPNNMQEKSIQVGMMAEIFSQSESGIMWLGIQDERDAAEDPNGRYLSSAFAMMTLQGEEFRDCFEIGLYGRPRIGGEHRNQYQAFTKLLSFSWRQIWVVQEMVLPPKIEFRYGDNRFRYEDLMEVKNGLRRHDEETKKFTDSFIADEFDPLLNFEQIVPPMITTQEDWHARRGLTLPELRRDLRLLKQDGIKTFSMVFWAWFGIGIMQDDYSQTTPFMRRKQ